MPIAADPDRFLSLRGRRPKQSRSRKSAARFWIATAASGRLAMMWWMAPFHGIDVPKGVS
jgi:hypothetical protein